MSLTLKGINFITLFTEDLQMSKNFYERVFGLTLTWGNEDSAVYKLGDIFLNILAISQADELVTPATVAPKKAGTRLVFTITVDNVDNMCQELSDLGITLVNGPMDRPWGIRTALITDPSGHLWELAHSLTG